MHMCSSLCCTCPFPVSSLRALVKSKQGLFFFLKSFCFNWFLYLCTLSQGKGGTQTTATLHWMAPMQQQKQQISAPCRLKSFTSCWENVTFSKTTLVANSSCVSKGMLSKDCQPHNQKVTRWTPSVPYAELITSTVDKRMNCHSFHVGGGQQCPTRLAQSFIQLSRDRQETQYSSNTARWQSI